MCFLPDCDRYTSVKAADQSVRVLPLANTWTSLAESRSTPDDVDELQGYERACWNQLCGFGRARLLGGGAARNCFGSDASGSGLQESRVIKGGTPDMVKLRMPTCLVH
jgi:hypothetical protein